MSVVKLYKVTADYRKNNLNKPKYYVIAMTKREAKQIFKKYVTWLDIYSCDECDIDTAKYILFNKSHNIIFKN